MTFCGISAEKQEKGKANSGAFPFGEENWWEEILIPAETGTCLEPAFIPLRY